MLRSLVLEEPTLTPKKRMRTHNSFDGIIMFLFVLYHKHIRE